MPETEEVVVALPGGVRAGLKGRNLAGPLYYVIVSVLLGMGQTYLLYAHELNEKTGRTEAVAQLVRQNIEFGKTQKDVEIALKEMTYIQTLSEAERRKLNLQMPDSLRARTR